MVLLKTYALALPFGCADVVVVVGIKQGKKISREFVQKFFAAINVNLVAILTRNGMIFTNNGKIKKNSLCSNEQDGNRQ
jgi:hypothetical protein